ncbi:hypothetical protein [Phenylobacterium soli]|uniref:Uncharacterized protein n=1 Tax=Phenylobacterium soli TaxID=2170551 RepID=A0A328ALC8_9CAUL|nr:hypothetical protein [Phenylobacterium soli]RAK55743.1 hypothetical protein DJ017_15100 [Phenylobacterium soli]
MASDAAAHLDAPHSDPAEDRRARARGVSADLEAIFGQPEREDATSQANSAPTGPTRGPLSGLMGRRAPAVETHRGLSLASVGALAAAALAGVAAGSLIVKPKPHAAAPSAAPALPRPDALPIEMAPPVQTPQAADASLAAPSPPIPAMALAPPPAASPRRAAVKRTRAKGTCCSYAEVKAADRRLRQAYAEAIRAGAPRTTIVSARERWETTRRRAAHDPARLVAGYRSIAADLQRASVHRRERAAPHAIRTRFHPRYPAWWW